MHIDREDMLELTRRMTVSRNCFSRIAGAYMDEEGFIDGTFNTHFLKLFGSEEKRKAAEVSATVSGTAERDESCCTSRRPGGHCKAGI